MDPSTLVRPALAGDWPAIEALLTGASLPLDGAREHLEHFAVAERDGSIVGCACVEPHGDAGLLRSVAVAGPERGRGLGEALTAHCVARAAAHGLTSLVLLTTTADRFFARLGFQVIARDAAPESVKASGQFQGVCCSSAVTMRLALP